MVLVEKRRTAAQLLLDFYKGRVTNDQLADGWPNDTHDPALRSVADGAWFLYDDLHEHFLGRREQQSYRVAKYVHLMLTFLSSELEYEWAGFPLWTHERFLELFNRQRRSMNQSGDASVWPFYRKADYVKAHAETRKSSA